MLLNSNWIETCIKLAMYFRDRFKPAFHLLKLRCIDTKCTLNSSSAFNEFTLTQFGGCDELGLGCLSKLAVPRFSTAWWTSRPFGKVSLLVWMKGEILTFCSDVCIFKWYCPVHDISYELFLTFLQNVKYEIRHTVLKNTRPTVGLEWVLRFKAKASQLSYTDWATCIILPYNIFLLMKICFIKKFLTCEKSVLYTCNMKSNFFSRVRFFPDLSNNSVLVINEVSFLNELKVMRAY
jgi:hypothetical protein